jgi:hypothetical protein
MILIKWNLYWSRDKMTKEEAIEYLQFNVYCNYPSEDLNPIHVKILNNK